MFSWFFSLGLYLTENSRSQLWRLIAARKHKRTHVRLHVKRALFLSYFNHNHKCREIWFKIQNMKFQAKSIGQGRKEYLTHNKTKANCTGHILRSSCLRKYVTERKMEGMRKLTERRGRRRKQLLDDLNPLTPNDPYRGHTAPLTSKRCILYIYLTNIGTEYFKHGIYSPFFLFKMQLVS